MKLKDVALQLCTCTWIEILTCAGIALYLLHLENYNLAALTVAIFSPLIAFHFVFVKLSQDSADQGQEGRLYRIRSSKHKLFG